MSEFGGLRKHEKPQRELVGLGSAALADDVSSFSGGVIRGFVVRELMSVTVLEST